MKLCLAFITCLIASEQTCTAGDEKCINDVELSDTSKSDKFIPFRFSHRSHFKDDWDSFIKTYAKWQDGLLRNKKLKCEDMQAVVFTPSAGLGDSANALSAAFLYTIRAGMMFFIDWMPWDWETGFSGPGFEVSFNKMIIKNRLCESPNLVRLKGHITANHMLAKIRKLNEDISFNAVRFLQTFFKPSVPVQKILDEINLPSNCVAVVVRTGWDDWQSFLLKHDHLKFPACLRGWRSSGTLPKDSPVFLTSDREDVKIEIEKVLIEMNFNVIKLTDSATHVMHNPDSMSKVYKTIADFHLISRCEFQMLTASSLFGRTAAAGLGGVRDEKLVYLSASDCDKPHAGYYRCASPKYPLFCPVHDTSYEWG